MKRNDGRRRGRSFAIIAVAAVLCFVLAAGLISVCFNGRSGGGRVYAEVTEQPFNDYSSISVTKSADLTVYRGVTTVFGLKKNLQVVGTSANGTNELLCEEYSVIVNGTALADSAVLVASSDTATESLDVVVSSGGAQALIKDLKVEAAPELSSLTLSFTGALTDDHTAATVHKILNVTDGGSPVRSDLYTVELSPEVLREGQTATVTVRTLDGALSDTRSATVTAAALVDVDLRVTDGVKLDGLYYKKDGKDVFFRGASNREVFANLVVTAIYANSRKVVAPTFDDYGRLTGVSDTGYTLSVDNTSNIGDDEAARNINIELTRGGNRSSASLSVNFAAVVISDIEVDATAFNAALAEKYSRRLPYTSLNIDDFLGAVTLVRNNGTKTNNIPANASLSFVGALTPTAQNLKDFLASSDKDGFKYSREVSIRLTSDSAVITSKPITIGGIEYVAPVDIDKSVGGTLASQTMHNEIDFDGLTVNIFYDVNDEFINVPLDLSDFDSSCVTAKITDIDGNVETLISKNTNSVAIDFAYGDLKTTRSFTANRTNGRLRIVKDTVIAPELDTSNIAYSKNDCYKQFKLEQLDYGAATVGDELKMTVEIFTDFGLSMPAPSAAAEYDAAKGRIDFGSGGTYYIKVSLPDKSDEYQLVTDSANVDISDVGDFAVYKITVTKGTIDLSVDKIASDVYYGDAVSLTVTGYTGGREYVLKNTADAEQVGDGEIAALYKLVYLAADADDYSPDKYSYSSYSEPTTLDAGTYHVYVVTQENTAFLESKSRVGNYAVLEILPKELSFTVNKQVYSRKAFTAKDFITDNGNFAFGDTADAVLTVSFVSATGVTGVATPPAPETADGKLAFTHAGVYTVELAINTDPVNKYSHNYVFKADQDTTLDFEIERRELSFVSASARGWTFGSVDPDPSPSYVKADAANFFAAVDAEKYYKADAAGEPIGEPIDISTSPFSAWAVGKYAAVFQTRYATTDEKAFDDYSLPTATAVFAVSAQSISKIEMEGGWTIAAQDAGTVGVYCAAPIWSELKNYDPQNTAPDGNKIIAVTVTGARLAPNAATQIDGLDGVFEYDDVNGNAGKLGLTEAGAYVVKIELNKNYLWNDGTSADLVFYGVIAKRTIGTPDLSSAPSVTYNGERQTVTVPLTRGGNVNTWDGDVLRIVSVVGKTLAAQGVTLEDADVSQVNGSFDVVAAGDYAVTVGIEDIDNYEWYVADPTASAQQKTADIEQTYTVKQAQFKAVWYESAAATDTEYFGESDDARYPIYKYKEGVTEQDTPYYAPYVDHTSDRAKLSVTSVAFYSDAACENATAVKTAGTYYAKVTGIGGEAVKNYTLSVYDVKLISIKFVVAPAALAKPVLTVDGTTVAEYYKGAAFDFAEYISNYADYVIGSTVCVTIEIDGRTDTEIKDVLFGGADGSIVMPYKIVVAPAENYAWAMPQDGVTDGKQEFEFEFTVTPRIVRFDWRDTGTDGNFVYDGVTVYSPSVDFVNNADAATESGAYLKLTDGNIDAGEYISKVSIAGARGANYAFATDAKTQMPYTVKKAVLDKPAHDGALVSFTEASNTVAFGKNIGGNYDWTEYVGKVTVAVSGSNNFVGVAESYKMLSDFSFDEATGVLTFVHAGDYSLTFTLNETARGNYCWSVEKQTEFASPETDCTDGFTVLRKRLVAPELAGQRAIPMTGGAIAPDNIVSGGNADGVVYKVTYGSYNGGFIGVTTESFEHATERNTPYYLKITVDADNNELLINGKNAFSPYDYEWVDNETDKKSETVSYVITAGGVYGESFYDETGVSMCLCYVLTNKLVGANFEFKNGGYTYGDNGYQTAAVLSLGAGLTFGDGGLLVDVDGNDSVFAYSEDSDPLFAGTLADIMSADYSVAVTFFRAGGEKVDNSDIVKGLPFEAGEYSARIDVTFTDSDLNDFYRTVPFTVTALKATIAWGDDSAVYNGERQTRKAEIVNLPEKVAGIKVAAPTLIVSKVTDVNFADGEVKSHTVRITGIDPNSVNCDNFTLDGVDTAAQFTILRKTVKVVAQNVSHVYGDKIEFTTLPFVKENDEDWFLNGDMPEKFINVAVVDAKGDDAGATPNVGLYYITPKLNEDQSKYYNYELAYDKAGEFDVQTRRISVEINSEDGVSAANSVYGAPVKDLNDDTSPVYTVTATNGRDAGIAGGGLPAGVAGSDVFVLAAGVTDTSTVGNGYAISCALTADAKRNYALETFGNYFYEITPARISDVEVVGYTGVYDAAEHNILAVSAIAVHEGTNKLSWEYSTDGTTWHAYSIGSNGVASVTVRNVSDADNREYYVRVSAANHETYVYKVGGETMSAVRVKVMPAELRVSVSMSVWFGEDGPDKHGDTADKWYMQSVDALRRAEGSVFSVSGFAGADGGAAEKALFTGGGDFYGIGGEFAYRYADNAYKAGDSVAKYELEFLPQTLACDNYTFKSEIGYLTVNALPVKVTVGDCRSEYNAVDPEQPVVKSVTTDKLSSYGDGTRVPVYHGADYAAIVVSLTTAALTGRPDVTTAPASDIPYAIEIQLSSDYTLENGGGYNNAVYTIVKAKNVISVENWQLFAGAQSYTQQPEADAVSAWTYGDRVTDSADEYYNPDGYDPDGAHAINEIALVSRDNTLEISLSRVGGANAVATVAGDQNITEAIAGVFASVYGASGDRSFYAGVYRLDLVMAASDNYEAFADTRYFVVGKKRLDIGALPIETVYGENIGVIESGPHTNNYPFEYSGIAKNGGNADVLADVIDFVFKSDYAAGYDSGSVKIGGYEIYAVVASPFEHYTVDGKDAYGAENYTVVFDKNVLTVAPRKITVEIIDQTHYYNFVNYENGAYVTDKFERYTFELKDGSSFAAGDFTDDADDNSTQTAFVLTSSAVSNTSSGYKTADRGVYPVYLTAGAHYFGGDGSANYEVTAIGSYRGELNADQTAIANKAGTHEIKAANLNITIDPVPYRDESLTNKYGSTDTDRRTYDGNRKYFGIVSKLDGVAVSGTLNYYAGSRYDHEQTPCDAPLNAGDYYIVYTLTDDNYVANSANLEFTIDKRSIRISAADISSDVTGDITAANNGYYFNGGTFTYEIAFDGLVRGESICLTVEKNKTNADLPQDAAFIDRFMTFIANVGNSDGVASFSFKVKNSGVYDVKLVLTDALDADNGFAASNYEFRNGNSASGRKDEHEISFKILPETLKAATNAVTVQYGSALGSTGRTSAFGVTFTSEHYGNGINDLTDFMLAGDKRDGYLVLPETYTAAMFDTDYAPASSAWGKTYYLKLNTAKIAAQLPDYKAYNFKIVPFGDNALSVVARKMTVEVNGWTNDADVFASCVYTGQGEDHNHNGCVEASLAANRAKFLSVLNDGDLIRPSDYVDPLSCVKLEIRNNARSVGKYRMAPVQRKSGAYSDHVRYDVTFVNAAGEMITNELNDADNEKKLPYWSITPATLYIKVGKYDASAGYDGVASVFGVPYGTAAGYSDSAESTFSLRYRGWVNGEGDDFGPAETTEYNHKIIKSCSMTSVRNGAAYSKWYSFAGDEFTVLPEIGDLKYNNYKIELVAATMKIGSLTVNAVANDVVYREKTDSASNIDYNNGISGDAHHVDLTFESALAGISLCGDSAGFDYADGNYNTTSDNADKAGGAPVKAGSDYTVTVTFNKNGWGAYNYVFSDGDANGTKRDFTFSVLRKEINVTWNASTAKFYLDEQDREIMRVVGYNAEIMEKASFNCGDSEVAELPSTDGGFAVRVDKAGQYVLTVKFNAYAAVNYRWKGSSDETKVITFVAVLDGNVVITIEDLSIEDWEYGAVASLPSAHLSHNMTGIINFTYGTADGLDIAEIEANGRVIDFATGNSRVYTGNVPQNAGWYIVCAEYKGVDGLNDAKAFRLFRIERATVASPTIEIISEGAGKNDVYSGKPLYATATHGAQVYIASFAGDRAAVDGGTRLSVINADPDGYAVRFALLNSDNYKWADDVQTANGEVVLYWRVAPASENAVIWSDSAIWNENAGAYELTYGDSYSITARTEYSSSVTYSYAVYDGGDYGDISDWRDARPTDAATYVVRVSCAGNGNFAAGLDYRKIVIGKAVLTATPYGSIVYGDRFSGSACDFELAGYLDNAVVNVVRDSRLEFVLADGTLDKNMLDHGEYKLLMKLDGEFVAGLHTANYNVVLAENGGVFTVARRPITVKIGNASSVYLSDVDLSDVSVTVTGGEYFGGEDVRAELGMTLTSSALEIDDPDLRHVGRYSITEADYANRNYIVSFIAGEYEITVLKVRVEIEAGGGEYGGEIIPAIVAHIYTVNTETEIDLGADALEFSYRYSGKNYNSANKPKNAGTYIATVTGIIDNDDYSLDLSAGDVSVPFIITKKTVDASLLVIEPIAYTGKAIEPIVKDDVYNVDGKTIYRLLPHKDFIHGGTYALTLELSDPANYRWKTVDDGIALREVSFTVAQAENSLVSADPDAEPAVEIAGWTYGCYNAKDNAPSAKVKFGGDGVRFEYSSTADGIYTSAAPVGGNAGDYYVRAVVDATADYRAFVSSPVKFTIEKRALVAPSLKVIASGAGKNDTYTGGTLRAAVVGFDSVLMGMSYDGNANFNGSELSVFAQNAATYNVRILLKTPENYKWADGTVCDESGDVAVLEWRVARKKIKKPTSNPELLIVNGKLLEYLPLGFDKELMKIIDNKSGYGGAFTAQVSLRDTENYEWEDGTTGVLSFKWKVVGAHTVFIAVTCSVAGVTAALGVVALCLFFRYRKKKLYDGDGEEA